jgi:hypothetical protein
MSTAPFAAEPDRLNEAQDDQKNGLQPLDQLLLRIVGVFVSRGVDRGIEIVHRAVVMDVQAGFSASWRELAILGDAVFLVVGECFDLGESMP